MAGIPNIHRRSYTKASVNTLLYICLYVPCRHNAPARRHVCRRAKRIIAGVRVVLLRWRCSVAGRFLYDTLKNAGTTVERCCVACVPDICRCIIFVLNEWNTYLYTHTHMGLYFSLFLCAWIDVACLGMAYAFWVHNRNSTFFVCAEKVINFNGN